MISENSLRRINKFEEKDLIPLICSASALRKEGHLRLLLSRAQSVSLNQNKLYESLLQNYLFAGYPSAMISLKILSEYFPYHNKNLLEKQNLKIFRERGIRNCEKIYGNKFSKLISNVKEFSPELSEWLVLEGYGKVFGRKGLSLKQRELNIISVLGVLKFEDQLYSHINGAFRTKSSREEIQCVLENLRIFGRNEWTDFGVKVLNRYLKEKGIESSIPL